MIKATMFVKLNKPFRCPFCQREYILSEDSSQDDAFKEVVIFSKEHRRWCPHIQQGVEPDTVDPSFFKVQFVKRWTEGRR